MDLAKHLPARAGTVAGQDRRHATRAVTTCALVSATGRSPPDAARNAARSSTSSSEPHKRRGSAIPRLGGDEASGTHEYPARAPGSPHVVRDRERG